MGVRNQAHDRGNPREAGRDGETAGVPTKAAKGEHGAVAPLWRKGGTGRARGAPLCGYRGRARGRCSRRDAARRPPPGDHNHPALSYFVNKRCGDAL